MRGSVVAIAGVGAVLLVGCEAILGISEHGLAPDAGEGRDGSSLRKEGGTDGGTDATTAHDGGHDATTKGKDGGRDGAHPADAAMDAPPPVFSCTKPTLAHPTLLLSITASDAGSGTFANPIFLMLGPQMNPVVVAQVQTQNGSSQQPIMAFELNGDSTVASSSFLGLAPIGVQLLEAHAGPGGTVEVLTSYPSMADAGSTNADSLQVLSLPSQLGDNLRPSDASALALATIDYGDGGRYQGAEFVDLPGATPPFRYLALEATGNGGMSSARLAFGPGAGGAEAQLVAGVYNSSGFGNIWNDRFLEVAGDGGGALYAFTPGLSDAGTPEYVASAANPMGASSPGLLLNPVTTAAFSGVLSIHPSAREPGKVVLLTATAASMTGPFVLYAATVAPSALPGLVVAGPAFSAYNVAAGTVVPIGGNNAPAAWNDLDEVAFAGRTSDGVGVGWVAPTGRLLTVVDLPRSNLVVGTSVAFGAGSSESNGATFYLAWTENLTDGGVTSGQALYEATIECAPGDGG